MGEIEGPHRRYNPLTGEWVLVSPHRDRRPWLGQVEESASEFLPAYDPDCYLCPGNLRAGGIRNDVYQGTFVFDNDFPALLPQEGSEKKPTEHSKGDFFRAEAVSGICRVVCFSPRHDLSLPELSLEEVRAVVDTWAEQTGEISACEDIAYVQVFENKGALMGCSNPHPHSQIWGTSIIPDEPAMENTSLENYQAAHGSCLLCDYLDSEQMQAERIVCQNELFTAVVPFWAIWPFETLVISHRHTPSLIELGESERTGLADILRQVTTCYDNLFEVSFPYSMGFHQLPGDPSKINHLHAHFYPPLLRSQSVRKFMVGFEMLAMPQRDLTPESAAARLRGLSPVHYLAK